MTPRSKQLAYSMTIDTFELFNRLFDELVIGEITDQMALYTIGQMSNAKKLKMLLEYFETIAKGMKD